MKEGSRPAHKHSVEEQVLDESITQNDLIIEGNLRTTYTRIETR
jgi:hypothetical protein